VSIDLQDKTGVRSGTTETITVAIDDLPVESETTTENEEVLLAVTG
jgi:hypothetical protein